LRIVIFVKREKLGIRGKDVGDKSHGGTGVCVFSGLPGSFGGNNFRVWGRGWADRDHRSRCGGRRWGGLTAFLNLDKTAVSSEVLLHITGLVAIDQLERTRVIGQSAEGDGGAGRRVLVGKGRGIFELAAHLVLNAGFLESADAHLSPAGSDHELDEGFLKRPFGFEFLEELVEEFAKTYFGLGVEEDGGGEQSVF
jgi:hypothetical protein